VAVAQQFAYPILAVSTTMRSASQVQSIIMFENLPQRMEDKPARLTILIDAEKKRVFDELCASQDITASQVVRQLIREYLTKHGVEWVPVLSEKNRPQ
jgi:hypothetical protein